MLLAIYSSADEVLIFRTSNGIVDPDELDEYFLNEGRDLNNYDIQVVEPPLSLSSKIRVEASKIHEIRNQNDV